MSEQTELSEIQTAAGVAAELAREATTAKAQPRSAQILDAAPFVILRDGSGNERIQIVDGRLEAPHRKTGTVKLHDSDSFIEHYKIHGNGAPVYASLDPLQFVAVLNDHTKEAAGYRDHRSLYLVKHSMEWAAWAAHNGSGAAFNSNESFALFLEENSLDIVKPDAASMLQIALNFRVNADVSFSTSQRLSDGHVELAYNNVVTANAQSAANGKLKIPEQFTIEIPVFAGLESAKYKIDARFRYRLREGKLCIWYELIHARKAKEQAFKDMLEQIKKATKAPILHGTPE